MSATMGCASRTPKLLETVVELSPSPALVTGADLVIVLVNRELERRFGYAREELLGNPVTILLPQGLPPGGASPFAPDVSAAAGVQVTGRHKNGSPVPLDVQVRHIDTTDGPRLIAYLRDGAERPARDDHRPSLEAQLEFERFLGGLSFEFINLPSDRVTDAIREGVARTCQMLAFDRGCFCRAAADGGLQDLVVWSADGIAPLHDPQPTRDIFPWTFERVFAGELITFETPDEIPDDTDRDSFRASNVQSGAFLPLSVDGQVIGAMGFETLGRAQTWTPEAKHRLTMIGSVFAQVLARQQREAAVRAAFEEVQRLKDRLQVENVYLRKEERELLRASRFVGQSPAIRRLLTHIQQVAPTDATILLRGETGTGKELLATYIHELGTRHAHPMVRVNCAAIPATLIESELFGRDRGAFTGALARQVGRFELADRSTIFLDEIGDLPSEVQVKLLRVLEERTIERLGNPRPLAIDVRIIAATHRNLEQLIADGQFREDLYYRLNVFPVHVPPLRERVEDIPLLLWRFVEEFSKAFGKRIDAIDGENLKALQAYSWPGNIRELRNAVERAMITTTTRRLVVPVPVTSAPVRAGSKLLDVEREHIREVLEAAGWRIRGLGGAAERLGMKPTTLETRIAKLGLRRPTR